MSHSLASLLMALFSAGFSTTDICTVLNALAIPAIEGLWTVAAVVAALPTALAIVSSTSSFSNLPNPVSFYRHIVDNALRTQLIN